VYIILTNILCTCVLQVTALTTAPVSIATKRPLEEHVEQRNVNDEPVNKQVKTEQTTDIQE